MDKEVKEIITQDNKRIIRLTLPDERWYGRDVPDSITGIPQIQYKPSMTWICSYWPKGIEYYKWLSEHGWDEAEAIKKEAGNKGDKIHQACEIIDKQGKISATDKFMNKQKGELEDLNFDELEAIKSYQEWVDEVKPICLANEMTIFGGNEITEWAGTLDRIYKIGEQIWIVDLKSSNYIWTPYRIQVSGYSHADIDYRSLGITDEEWKNRKLAILRLGYKYNKIKKYKFDEIEDLYDLFLVTCKIWKQENPDTKPKQRDFPLEIQSEWIKQQLVVKEQTALANLSKNPVKKELFITSNGIKIKEIPLSEEIAKDSSSTTSPSPSVSTDSNGNIVRKKGRPKKKVLFD